MSLLTEIKKEFKESIILKENVSAAAITTFALGGKIDLLLEPGDLKSLSSLIEFFFEKKINYKIVGNGSNVLISDQGLKAPLLRLGKGFNKCSYQEVDNFFSSFSKFDFKLAEKYRFLVQGGSSLMNLSKQFTSLGFSGLEFAAGIPATLAGAVFMNAGAHGHCISEVITKVYLLLGNGQKKELEISDLEFQYRKSNLPKNSIVYAVELELSFLEKELINQKRSSSLEYRKKTQPLQFPSAGSVFKNPSPEELALSRIEKLEGKIAAAELLENLGLKGYRHGGVCFSEKHANWLIKAADQAEASDVLYLIKYAQAQVEQEFNLVLSPEIILW